MRSIGGARRARAGGALGRARGSRRGESDGLGGLPSYCASHRGASPFYGSCAGRAAPASPRHRPLSPAGTACAGPAPFFCSAFRPTQPSIATSHPLPRRHTATRVRLLSPGSVPLRLSRRPSAGAGLHKYTHAPPRAGARRDLLSPPIADAGACPFRIPSNARASKNLLPFPAPSSTPSRRSMQLSECSLPPDVNEN